ncbi:hypothetical protein [Metaclostridioides mangenotii]|uniref:hypothetical protein n=1 Tax=Metaclostridioides mangenotii TaxID=1540 RepID=UPI000486472C|nr:hypothetical protein [Clostridioides mangenotii]
MKKPRYTTEDELKNKDLQIDTLKNEIQRLRYENKSYEYRMDIEHSKLNKYLSEHVLNKEELRYKIFQLEHELELRDEQLNKED